jgi:hypothetical protein
VQILTLWLLAGAQPHAPTSELEQARNAKARAPSAAAKLKNLMVSTSYRWGNVRPAAEGFVEMQNPNTAARTCPKRMLRATLTIGCGFVEVVDVTVAK